MCTLPDHDILCTEVVQLFTGLLEHSVNKAVFQMIYEESDAFWQKQLNIKCVRCVDNGSVMLLIVCLP